MDSTNVVSMLASRFRASHPLCLFRRTFERQFTQMYIIDFCRARLAPWRLHTSESTKRSPPGPCDLSDNWKSFFFRKSTDPLRWYSVDWLSVNIHGVSPWFDSPCGLPGTVSGPPPDTWRLGEADKWWDVSRITQAFAGLLCCGTSVGGLSSSVSRRHLPVVFLDQKLCGYVPTRLCQSILRIRYGSLKLKLIFLLPPPSSLALHGLCPPLLIWWTRKHQCLTHGFCGTWAKEPIKLRSAIELAHAHAGCDDVSKDAPNSISLKDILYIQSAWLWPTFSEVVAPSI